MDQTTDMGLNERARQRLKAEKARRHLSERDIGDLLQWSQSKVAQKLSGRTPITLDELESLCFALSIAPTEAVRDHGLEFCAEMTPSEMRLLEQIRKLDDRTREGIMGLLHARTFLEPRSATKPREPMKRLR